LIAALLLYFSYTDFSTLCKKDGNTTKKDVLQKFASFSFIYLLLWRIGKPLLEMSSGQSQYSPNSKASYGVVGLYGLGLIILSYMKLKPSVFNKEESKPVTVTILKDGGLIVGIMSLFATITLTLKDTK
jgi:hypothetical protein